MSETWWATLAESWPLIECQAARLEKLIERAQKYIGPHIEGHNTAYWRNLMLELIDALRSLAAEKATYKECLIKQSAYIHELIGEKAKVEQERDTIWKAHGDAQAPSALMIEAAAMLRSQEHLKKALDNMTEEYHHLRAEKESLTSTVNDMATMVNEARAKLEEANLTIEGFWDRIIAAQERARKAEAKLSRAREELKAICHYCDEDLAGPAGHLALAILKEISPSEA